MKGSSNCFPELSEYYGKFMFLHEASNLNIDSVIDPDVCKRTLIVRLHVSERGSRAIFPFPEYADGN
jgi:hypothetical protein